MLCCLYTLYICMFGYTTLNLCTRAWGSQLKDVGSSIGSQSEYDVSHKLDIGLYTLSLLLPFATRHNKREGREHHRPF